MKYKFSEKLSEIAIIQPDVFYDFRGEYIETWNIENYKVIGQMAPYGVGNPKPVFILKNEEIYSIKEFGKEKNHLEIS